MPTDANFSLDLLDGRDEGLRLRELDTFLLLENASRVVALQASLDRWPELVRSLCELRGRGVLPLVGLVKGESVHPDALLLERFRFLADWDQCSLANVLGVVSRWLPDAFRSTLDQEAKLEARFFREWAAAAAEPRLGRYPALPWRRFMRNVNEENYRFAEACVLEQNDPPALAEAVKRLLEAKRKTVNLFPKKFDRPKRTEEVSP